MSPTFSAAGEFSATNAQGSAWSFVYKTDRVRDGNYQVIESHEPALVLTTAGEPLLAEPGPNPVAWQVAGDTPWVALNDSGSEQTFHEWGRTIPWPANVLVVHPGEDGMVVVRWQSPTDCHVDIDFAFADAYPSGGGDGIAWFVEIDAANRTLASGQIDRGGPGTGPSSLTDIGVARGTCIHFVVDSRGDHSCDWTRVDATITVKDTDTT